MDSWFFIFGVVVLGIVVGAARMVERAYYLQQKLHNVAARLLLQNWIISGVFMISLSIWVATLVFGNRLVPGLSSQTWYRAFMVISFAVITWGKLIAMELAWRKLTQ